MSERWMPENGKGYWFILDTNPAQAAWCGSQYDIARWEAGNVFKTHDQALIASINIKSLLLSLHDNNLATNLQDKQGKPLPKLTTEVFDRPDCPEDAKIAVVNDDGSAYWGSFNTARQNFRGGWNGENGSWFPIPGKWDASDWQHSLIERPVKKPELPEWCKVGEWVYCTKTNYYGKILSVDKEEVNICIPPDETFSAKTNMMLKNGRTARLRPYNAEEMKALVGKVIEDKIGNRCLMTCFTVGDNKIVVFNRYCDADDLLKTGYTINGSPCGVLEHLENGEWVE